jgi:hypothetical protein
LNRFNLKSALDFYYLVGKGKIDPKEIKKIKEIDAKKPKKSHLTNQEILEAFPEKNQRNHWPKKGPAFHW